jgi:hypothetical protein
VTLRAGIDFYSAKPLKPPKVRTYPARLPREEDVALPGHDGDSWTLSLDRGFKYENLVVIRGFNVFAPELKQLGGGECRKYANQWLLGTNAGAIWPFLVDTVLDGNGHEIETLGRTVCIVRSTSGASLNDDMNAYIDANGFPHGTGG